MLPNINEAITELRGKLFPFGWLRLLWRLKIAGLGTARVPLMGVTKSISATTEGKLLPLKLIYSLEERAQTLHIGNIELSWILEDNWPMRRLLEAINCQHKKTYRIYEKQII